jgi:hypothetical protein
MSCPVRISALSRNAGTFGGQSRQQKVHWHAVGLAQGGIERLPGRVLSRCPSRERQGCTHLIKCLGSKPRHLCRAAGGRLALGCEGGFDVCASPAGKWRGVLTGETSEQAATS